MFKKYFLQKCFKNIHLKKIHFNSSALTWTVEPTEELNLKLLGSKADDIYCGQLTQYSGPGLPV